MAPRGRKPRAVPTAVVLSAPQALKPKSAEGKLELMQRTRELTDGGEKILTFLTRVLAGDGTISQGLDAAKILLAYGWGKPIETQVTADVSPSPTVGPSAAALSSAQLEAVITGAVGGSQQPALGLPQQVERTEGAEQDVIEGEFTEG